MRFHSDLAVLRAWVKLLQDVTYRLQSSIDAMEKSAQHETVGPQDHIADEIPY